MIQKEPWASAEGKHLIERWATVIVALNRSNFWIWGNLVSEDIHWLHRCEFSGIVGDGKKLWWHKPLLGMIRSRKVDLREMCRWYLTVFHTTPQNMTALGSLPNHWCAPVWIIFGSQCQREALSLLLAHPLGSIWRSFNPIMDVPDREDSETK